MIELFKRGKYWAGEEINGDTVWGTGETPEAARADLEKVLASIKSEESSTRDNVQEWIELNSLDTENSRIKRNIEILKSLGDKPTDLNDLIEQMKKNCLE